MTSHSSKDIPHAAKHSGKKAHCRTRRSTHGVCPTRHRHRRKPEIVALPEPQDDIDRIILAIAARESAGDKVGYGDYGAVGGRSLGFCQVHSGNLAAWTKQAGFKNVSRQAFLKDPDMQRKTVRAKVQEYVDSGLPLEDVVAKWNSGSTLEVAKERQIRKTGKSHTAWYTDTVLNNHAEAKEKWPMASDQAPTPVADTVAPPALSSLKQVPTQVKSGNFNALRRNVQLAENTGNKAAVTSSQPMLPVSWQSARSASLATPSA